MDTQTRLRCRFLRGLFSLWLCGWLASHSPSAVAGSAELEPLQALIARGGAVSALVVRLSDAEILASLNPDQRLIPASLTKLVLAAAALETWGSEHSFQTRLLTAGKRAGTVLKGDLIVAGAGDPSLNNEKLWFLCTDVARMGIKTVKGDLVLNTSLFGPIEPPDQDRQKAATASSHAFDGGLSAVAVNYSTLAAVVGPGTAAGQPAVIGLEPYPLATVTVVNEVTTSAGGYPQITASRRRGAQRDILTVTGQVPLQGLPVRIYRSVSNADEYAGSTFKAFLARAGVTVKGKVRVEQNPPPAEASPLAMVEGYPLHWQIRELLGFSNNFIADMLTIHLDLDDRKLRGATLRGGARRLSAYLNEVLSQSPVKGEKDSGEAVLRSGSGLTPANQLSARDLVAVLAHMYRNPLEFPVFLAALPTVRQEGTLQQRFSSSATRHLQTRIRAKTGTLSEPYEAVGLAGYDRLPDGGWAAFAILVNGTAAQPALGAESIRDAIDLALARILPMER
jgi:D-alanyl-D-alanine carboxypeptidase/D-alanyl-D-alanine-endopeptidase (penicillin-binding protein 4)